MAHDPLSPSEALRTPVGAVLSGLSVIAFAYSIVIAAEILLGLVVVSVLAVGPYLSYRLLLVADSVADGVQRIADARERELERDSRFDRPVDRDASETGERGSERVTERER